MKSCITEVGSKRYELTEGEATIACDGCPGFLDITKCRAMPNDCLDAPGLYWREIPAEVEA
jgi:hypothetical protein